MRRILIAAAMSVGVLAATACQPTEPAMTITAKRTSSCLANPTVEGKVTPATATPKVVLQRSSGGKWTDFKWYQTAESSEVAHVITDALDGGGAYVLRFDPSNLKGTQKFRVRSNGSGYVSPSVYFTFPQVCA